MKSKHLKTFSINIFISGPAEKAKEICREYCLSVGLCVTVTKTTFIYSGGEEIGVVVGLLNYPKYPAPENKLIQTAYELANKLLEGSHQHSVLIEMPHKTEWMSKRQ